MSPKPKVAKLDGMAKLPHLTAFRVNILVGVTGKG